jgi:hypothetical protein
LASRANISIAESNALPDFEREAFINLLIKDLKQKEENEKLKGRNPLGRK